MFDELIEDAEFYLTQHTIKTSIIFVGYLAVGGCLFVGADGFNKWMGLSFAILGLILALFSIAAVYIMKKRRQRERQAEYQRVTVQDH